MTKGDSQYPDISDIVARKASGRRQRPPLSFAEKLGIVDALKERAKPLVRARQLREQQPVQRAVRRGE